MVKVGRRLGIILLDPSAIKAIQNGHIVASMLITEVSQDCHDPVGLEAVGDEVPIEDGQVDHFVEADSWHSHRTLVDRCPLSKCKHLYGE